MSEHEQRTSKTRVDEALQILRRVVNHWNEFGPECGFDECVNYADSFLREEEAPEPPSGLPSEEAVRGAFDHVNALCQFAYQQGFHELGYNPVAVLMRAVNRANGTAVTKEETP